MGYSGCSLQALVIVLLQMQSLKYRGKSVHYTVRCLAFQLYLSQNTVFQSSPVPSCWFNHYVNLPMLFNAIFHTSVNSIFQIKICGIFLIYDPNIDCGCLWGGSNKHPQSICFPAKIRKNNLHPGKPHFFLYKVGVKRVLLAWTCQYDKMRR